MAKVNINIDGHALQVEAGTTIIQAAHEAEKSIPYYCYHPGLVPDGNCRICLVAVEKMPKLVVACKTAVADGMVITTKSPAIETARKGVMEFMLINHPIDCPVCDQAGECKLQDYYFEYDLQNSRFKETKVHKPKVQRLGEHVMFDAERCIMCSRCVRFTRDVSQSHELGLFNRGDHTEIGLAPGTTLDNPYSMNTIDICPVGALTSRDFRFRKRVWFLDEHASTCPGCATGCSVKYDVSTKENKIYRVRGDKDLTTNGYWMCDDGRFVHERNASQRLLTPSVANADQEMLRRWKAAARRTIVVEPTSTTETYEAVAALRAAGTAVAVGTGYAMSDGYKTEADDFLIDADKNPNRAGLKRVLGDVPSFSASQGPDELVVYVGRDPGNLPAGSILLSPWLPRSAHVLAVPTLSWWERVGTTETRQGERKPVRPVVKAASRQAQDETAYLGALAAAIQGQAA